MTPHCLRRRPGLLPLLPAAAAAETPGRAPRPPLPAWQRRAAAGRRRTPRSGGGRGRAPGPGRRGSGGWAALHRLHRKRGGSKGARWVRVAGHAVSKSCCCDAPPASQLGVAGSGRRTHAQKLLLLLLWLPRKPHLLQPTTGGGMSAGRSRGGRRPTAVRQRPQRRQAAVLHRPVPLLRPGQAGTSRGRPAT